MKRNLKVGIYTLASFVLIVFLIGAITLGRKGASTSQDTMQSNMPGNLFGYKENVFDKMNFENDSEDANNKSSAYSSLQIKWNGEDIFITESDDIDSMSIYIISGESKRNIYSTNYITKKNATVKINNKSLTDSLEIMMPSYCFSDDITINAPCANIYLNGINTTDIEISTNFGNILAKDVITDSLSADSQSGIIYTLGGKFVTMDIQSDSGNIYANSNADEFYLSSQTGDVTFAPITDWVRADISSDSGDITLQLNPQYAHTIELKPQDSQITFDEKLNYKETNNKYIYKDGSADINIQCDSGDIYVNVNENE